MSKVRSHHPRFKIFTYLTDSLDDYMLLQETPSCGKLPTMTVSCDLEHREFLAYAIKIAYTFRTLLVSRNG